MRPWTPTAHSTPPLGARRAGGPGPGPDERRAGGTDLAQTFLLCGKMGSKASPVRRRIRRCSRLRPGLASA